MRRNTLILEKWKKDNIIWLINKNYNENLYTKEVYLQSCPLRTCSQRMDYSTADRIHSKGIMAGKDC